MAIPLKNPHFQAFQAGSRLTIHIIINDGGESISKICIKSGQNNPTIIPGIKGRSILKKGNSFHKRLADLCIAKTRPSKQVRLNSGTV